MYVLARMALLFTDFFFFFFELQRIRRSSFGSAPSLGGANFFSGDNVPIRPGNEWVT